MAMQTRPICSMSLSVSTVCRQKKQCESLWRTDDIRTFAQERMSFFSNTAGTLFGIIISQKSVDLPMRRRIEADR